MKYYRNEGLLTLVVRTQMTPVGASIAIVVWASPRRPTSSDLLCELRFQVTSPFSLMAAISVSWPPCAVRAWAELSANQLVLAARSWCWRNRNGPTWGRRPAPERTRLATACLEVLHESLRFAPVRGLGLEIYRLSCGTFYGHGGSLTGTMSIAYASVDGRDGAVVAINLRSQPYPDLSALAQQMICPHLG
jgi:hypothetical protein